jgi:hypothetical protein
VDDNRHYGQEQNSQALSEEQRSALRKDRREARELGKKKAKMMELQYWLEFVDTKHRHGSNLRKYHAYWKTQDTSENFFHWLDYGAGKDLNLEECSRERLDRQQVRYLSREERLKYLVEVDSEGLLRWAKNGEKVWTKDELFKDSLEGIVPTTDTTPAFENNEPGQAWESSSDDDESSIRSRSSLSSSSSKSNKSTTDPDEGSNYINEDFHRARGPAKLKYMSAGVVFNHMIRSSLKKGHKWIFVCDTQLRLYIGYKQAGAFQHSSFLHGSRVLSAGQIKVKDGRLRRLSPLSGHYRVPAANFRTFIKSLNDSGVDMSKLSVSRSYAVLVGLEVYVKSRRKVKSGQEKVVKQKDKILDPEKVREEEEKNVDKSKSAAKEREVLEKQRREEEEAARIQKLERRTSRKNSMKGWLQRLGIRSSSARDEWSPTTARVKDKEKQREAIREERVSAPTGPEDGIPPADESRS